MQIPELHCKDAESESLPRDPRSWLVIMFYVFISCWLCWVFPAARGLSLGAAIGDASPVALRGLLVAGASLLAGRAGAVAGTPRPPSAGWAVGVERGCSAACGSFRDQEFNLSLPHWQIDSLPPSHQGSPITFIWRPLLHNNIWEPGKPSLGLLMKLN